VDVVHGDECRRHAAARAHELTAAQPQPLAVDIGQLVDTLFHLLLRRALRGRQVLAVRHDLRRYRRRRRCRLGACNKALFSFAEPTTHRRPPFGLIDQPGARSAEVATPSLPRPRGGRGGGLTATTEPTRATGCWHENTTRSVCRNHGPTDALSAPRPRLC